MYIYIYAFIYKVSCSRETAENTSSFNFPLGSVLVIQYSCSVYRETLARYFP